MRFVQNFPFFCMLATLICAVISSVLKPRTARWLTAGIITLVTAMTTAVLVFVLMTGESYVYRMGHFSAPWGNEIRVGPLEAGSMLLFCAVMLLSYLGGMQKSILEIDENRYNVFCVLLDLILLALQALVYTNDLFTAYVFIEINTLAAAGLILVRSTGRPLVAAVRYMMMNLLGSSLFLLGIVLLYTITGHLLMSNIHEAVAVLAATGEYKIPMAVIIALLTVGLAIKSALFPFEQWLPGAYGNATPIGSAVLSSIVSKGYIFLLIKIYVRVLGMDVVRASGVLNVLFIFGAIGMIEGSVHAIRAKTTRMMVAYSSAAQIGYIFCAMGLGTDLGLVAALWHIVAHSLVKSMLFIATNVMRDANGDNKYRKAMRGGFYRCPVGAAAFVFGAVNMVGVPLMSIFATKILMADAGIAVGGTKMVITLAALAASTLLNSFYFLGTGMSLFVKPKTEAQKVKFTPPKLTTFSLLAMMALNLVMGFAAEPVMNMIISGLAVFG